MLSYLKHEFSNPSVGGGLSHQRRGDLRNSSQLFEDDKDVQ